MESYEQFEQEVEDLASDLEFSEASLVDKKRTELIEMCKSLELASYGSKAELVERLVKYAQNQLGTGVLTAKSSFVAVEITKEEKEELGRAVRI